MPGSGERGRVLEIIKLLGREYPDPKIEIKYSNPLELLVATILSAQCTDKRVNEVTEKLFRKYRTVEDYAKAELEIFEQEIKSTGFYRNKARNIIAAAKIIKEKYGGKVPNTMEDLLMLPGVARKTANIVLANAYNIPAGIAVDTHVSRISQRLKLTKEKNPEKIEKDLMEVIPKEYWIKANKMFVLHGRYVCTARNPACGRCVLNKICPSARKE